jgi:hypothetical protein
MGDPQPTLVELLVRHVLLPREYLPQIEINSNIPDVLALVAWMQQRHYSAYLSHRKRRETES